MTTQPQAYGLTVGQLAELRERHLSAPVKDKFGERPIGQEFAVVQVIESRGYLEANGRSHVWPARLVEIVDGTVVHGDFVWVRNATPMMRAGQVQPSGSTPWSDGAGYSFLSGNTLACRMYGAVYTNDSAFSDGASVLALVSTQSVRWAQLTDVYTSTGSPTSMQFSWVEMVPTGSGTLVTGWMSGSCQAYIGVTYNALAWPTIQFSPSIQSGTFTIAKDGGSPTTMTWTNEVSIVGAIETAFSITLTTVPGGWLLSSAHTFTIDATGLLPANPRYPAFNVLGSGTAVQAQQLVGRIVALVEGKGAYPSAVIRQTAWGRTDISTPAVIQLLMSSFIEGAASLVLWQTKTQTSQGFTVPFNATASSLQTLINAAAASAGWTVTFTVTGTNTRADPWVITAAGDYQDYGLTWNQADTMVDAWGDMEFEFTAPSANQFIAEFRDTTTPTPNPPTVSVGDDLFFPVRNSDKATVSYTQIECTSANVADQVIKRKVPTGSGDSTNPRYVWEDYAAGASRPILQVVDLSTGSTLSLQIVDGRIITIT